MAEFILKDWYGKEKSFDHETIYVKDAEGNLMPFTHGTGNPTLEDLEVTENGNYKPSEGVDGFGSVKVAVPIPEPVVQPLDITENGTYTAPDGVDGYSPVTVNVPTPEIVLQDKTITENGTYTADSGFDGLGKVIVDIASSEKAITIKKGTMSYTNGKCWHSLGVIPDVFIVYLSYIGSSDTMKDGTLFGIAQKSNGGYLSKGAYWISRTNGQVTYGSDIRPYGLDSEKCFIFSDANEESVTIKNVCFSKSGTYEYIAITGLL